MTGSEYHLLVTHFLFHSPNSYVKRTADAGSATVTANPNAEYAVINSGATNVVHLSEHEMVPIYKQIPPGKRPAPGYDDCGVDVAVNTHVTSAIDSRPNGQTAVYEKIRTYSNVGPKTHLYEMPRTSKTLNEFSPEVVPDGLNYAVPRSRQNTVTTADGTPVPYSVPQSHNKAITQGLPPTSTRVSEGSQSLYNTPRSRQNTMTQQMPPSTTDGTPTQYAIPKSHNETVTQGSPPTSTKDSQNLYNTPRSRQNSMTEQTVAPNTAVEDTTGKKVHNTYDRLEKLSATQSPHTAEKTPTQASLTGAERHDHHTYATPRPPSMTANTTHSHFVAIDLGQLGTSRPTLSPSTDTCPAPNAD